MRDRDNHLGKHGDFLSHNLPCLPCNMYSKHILIWLRLDLSWNLLDSEVGFSLDSREGVELWKVWNGEAWAPELLNCPKSYSMFAFLVAEGSDKYMESTFYSRTAQGVFESKDP